MVSLGYPKATSGQGDEDETMASVKLSEDLLPVSDLSFHAAKVVHQTQETGRPVVLTEDGRGDAVVLSLEAFEELQGSPGRLTLKHAVEEAEKDITAGHWVENDEALTKLERWAGGRHATQL
jgi:antitoxin YefM